MYWIWPKVTVETVYSIRSVDVIHEGVDVAIRLGELRDSELSTRKLGELTYGLYAAPDYLGRAGTPRRLDDLKRHDLVMKTSSGRASWTLVRGAAVETVTLMPRCALDNIVAARNLTLSGLGIGLLPRYLAAPHVADRTLVHVLTARASPPMPVHAVFASTRYMDPKVRAFVDLCREAFRDDEP